MDAAASLNDGVGANSGETKNKKSIKTRAEETDQRVSQLRGEAERLRLSGTDTERLQEIERELKMYDLKAEAAKLQKLAVSGSDAERTYANEELIRIRQQIGLLRAITNEKGASAAKKDDTAIINFARDLADDRKSIGFKDAWGKLQDLHVDAGDSLGRDREKLQRALADLEMPAEERKKIVQELETPALKKMALEGIEIVVMEKKKQLEKEAAVKKAEELRKRLEEAASWEEVKHHTGDFKEWEKVDWVKKLRMNQDAWEMFYKAWILKQDDGYYMNYKDKPDMRKHEWENARELSEKLRANMPGFYEVWVALEKRKRDDETEKIKEKLAKEMAEPMVKNAEKILDGAYGEQGYLVDLIGRERAEVLLKTRKQVVSEELNTDWERRLKPKTRATLDNWEREEGSIKRDKDLFYGQMDAGTVTKIEDSLGWQVKYNANETVYQVPKSSSSFVESRLVSNVVMAFLRKSRGEQVWLEYGKTEGNLASGRKFDQKVILEKAKEYLRQAGFTDEDFKVFEEMDINKLSVKQQSDAKFNSREGMFRVSPEPKVPGVPADQIVFELGVEANKHLVDEMLENDRGVLMSEGRHWWGRASRDHFGAVLQVKLDKQRVETGGGVAEINNEMKRLLLTLDDQEIRQQLGITDDLANQLNDIDWLNIKLAFLSGKYGIDRDKDKDLNKGIPYLYGNRSKVLGDEVAKRFDTPFHAVLKNIYFAGWREGKRGEPKLGYGDDEAWKVSETIKLLD